MPQLRIPAVYMRGGTSKGVFFRASDLPGDARERDALLLRVIGSPDPYGKQIDGMGAATSSTSKVVILAPSERGDSDVDYLFGQVAIDRAMIDWSGNCGNLTSAVGPFAIAEGWVEAPRDGTALVRIWQKNIGKRILAHVPVRAGEVVEEGDFTLDGVAFPAAEIRIEFLDPGGDGGESDAGGATFPTGNVVDALDVPEVGRVEATLIAAGIPTAFVDASSLGLEGTELQPAVNGSAEVLRKCEAIRAQASVRMGLSASVREAGDRPHTPKIAFVSPSRPYTASNGKPVASGDIDLAVRMISMGLLHHALPGTGAVATAVACAVEGTLPHRARKPAADPLATRIGHPSGTLTVGAIATKRDGVWSVERAVMSRSARRLMEGWVRIPAARNEYRSNAPQSVDP